MILKDCVAIVTVKWVNIKESWYEARLGPSNWGGHYA